MRDAAFNDLRIQRGERQFLPHARGVKSLSIIFMPRVSIAREYTAEPFITTCVY